MKNNRFVKENFRWDRLYLNYVVDASQNPWGVFVARFKYNRRDKASFQKFLIENFTISEYMEAHKSGIAPLEILKAKGWVSPTESESRKAWAEAASKKPVTITIVT